MSQLRSPWYHLGASLFFGDDRRLALAFWVCLALYALVLPVGGTIALRNLGFFGMLAVFATTLWRQRRSPLVPLWPAWLVYGLTALVSLSYAIDPAYSLGEVKVEILFPLLVVVLGVNAITSLAEFRRLLLILVTGNSFLVAFSLATAAVGGSTKDGLVGTINTGVGNFSTYLITVMPFIAWLTADAWPSRRRLAWLLIALLLADLLALLLTLNRQGVIALAVEAAVAGLWLLAHRPSRRTLVLLAAALALLGTIFVHQYRARDILAQQGQFALAAKSDIRWYLWSFTTESIAEHPWSGGGFGLRAFKLMHPDFAPDSMLWHAHNMLLNKGVQMGLPGIAAFLLLFLSVFRTLGMRLRGPPATRALVLACLSMVFGVFVKNMTDDFFFREMGYLFWLLVGASLGVAIGALREAGTAS